MSEHPPKNRPMTAEELQHLYLPNKSTELVRGRLVVRESPGTYHGRVQATLTYFVTAYVRQHALGVVFGQDTGFKIESNPDTVRGPDLSFVRAERARDIPQRGFAALPPDLAVEILSPDDRPGEVREKVSDYLSTGTRLVWVIDPKTRTARVHRADGSVALVPPEGVLEGEDVLPGFSCAVAEVLE